MAERPAFISVTDSEYLVKTTFVTFDWFPGFSVAQKQRSITSLHQNISKTLNIENILEISSKSLTDVGVKASAFNLMIETRNIIESSVSNAHFRQVKFLNIAAHLLIFLDKTSREAKKDERLKSSGRLSEFRFYQKIWPLLNRKLYFMIGYI
ncbi:DarT1-associated NADAR antitoxin family protein [Pseudomonas fragariae (ex Marin et al. 2024)]|uniref:DarT1-associated NADAR antitoxin family protein n=1 Tax=Pseudomonas fragariae (ex Marin et al. 2024) TaxID=3080056 RepID=UPI003F7A5DEB